MQIIIWVKLILSLIYIKYEILYCVYAIYGLALTQLFQVDYSDYSINFSFFQEETKG